MGVLVAFLFALLYNVSFLAAPTLTTGRLAVLVLLGLYPGALRQAWELTMGTGRVLVACLALLILYSSAAFVLESGGDATQLSRLLNFAFYVLLGVPLFAAASGYDLQRFLRGTALAVGIQSALIGLSFASPGYRAMLAGLVVQGGNIPLTSPFQAPGFSNSAGALLSLTQGIGVCAALLLARLEPARAARRRWLLLAIVGGLSTIVVGRTGLQLSVVVFAAYLVLGGPAMLWRVALLAAALAALLGAVGPTLVELALARNPEATRIFGWAFEFFTAGTRGAFFREFAGQEVPPLSLESVIGTGRVVGPDGVANASGSDSGYVQTYYALGLPAAVVFYAAYFACLLTALARVRVERLTLGLLVVLTIALEVKEPFIFKYVLPFFLLLLLRLAGRRGDHDLVPTAGP
jgi:hypothetical protein